MSRASRHRSGGSIWCRLEPHEIEILAHHHETLAEQLRRCGRNRAADRLEVRASELRLAAVLPGEKAVPE